MVPRVTDQKDNVLTHIDAAGRASMVDVGGKEATRRVALAGARLRTRADVVERMFAGDLPKGEALAVARVAGIQAAKRTWELIPLCHPLQLSKVEVNFRRGEDGATVEIEARAICTGPTGVEMEALTAAATAALTLYDMAKAVDRAMVIEAICLLEKSGGRSGNFVRQGGLP